MDVSIQIETVASMRRVACSIIKLSYWLCYENQMKNKMSFGISVLRYLFQIKNY